MPTTKLFGIQLKASIRLTGVPWVDLPAEQIRLYRDLPFPLCLILFDMQTDRGYYRWLVEPEYGSDGRPTLLLIGDDGPDQKANMKITGFIELTAKSLNSLVTSVNTWYAASKAPVAQAS